MPEPTTPARNLTSVTGRDVEGLLESGLALLRDRSDAVLNAVDDGIYILDRQGHTVFANEAAVRLLGYTLREMLGQSQHALVHHKRPDGAPYPLEECPIYHSVSDGIYERVGGDVFWRKDGRPLRVDYTSVPIKDGRTVEGAVVTFRDATVEQRMREQEVQLETERTLREQRDRALSEVAAARELLEQVFAHVPASVSMTRGADHRIVLANAAARTLAGRDDLVGRTVTELFPELAGQEAVRLLDNVMQTGEPVEARDLLVRWDPQGTGVPRDDRFDIQYIPVRDASGAVVGVLTYSTLRESGQHGDAAVAS